MTTQTDLLKPGEVARMFRVDAKTVTRWALAGRIPSIKTPGGHARFRRVDIERLLAGAEEPEATTFVEGEHGTLTRYDNGVRTGAVWGPAVDNGFWFVRRIDVSNAATLKLPTREDAVAYLKQEATA